MAAHRLHPDGRLLAHGRATVSVTGPGTPWPRRAAYTALLVAGGLIQAAWLWLPLETATHTTGHGIRTLAAYTLALAVVGALLLESGNMRCAAARSSPPPPPSTTRTTTAASGGRPAAPRPAHPAHPPAPPFRRTCPACRKHSLRPADRVRFLAGL
ncbi:hypothetical protein [Streptomyces sp. CA-106110]|uniref:hypothetical protein n=1 Tax=Streptomyces sp. CA-106110 TaxID=3240044 RepID=UPI003D91B380